MMDYEQEYHKLLAKYDAEKEEWHRKELEMIDKYLVDNSKLTRINEHMPKIVGYISLFAFGLIVFVFRPDIFVLLIKAFNKACE